MRDRRPPSRLMRALARGDEAALARYRRADGTIDPQRVALAVACGARRCGWGYYGYARYLRHPGHAGFDPVREEIVRVGGSLSWLRELWERASTVVAEPPGVVRVDAVRLGAVALSLGWAGRSGATRLAVLLGLVAEAYRHGTREVRIGHEELAVRAGVSVPAERRAVRWLADQGWVKVTSRSAGGLVPTRYRVVPRTRNGSVPVPVSIHPQFRAPYGASGPSRGWTVDVAPGPSRSDPDQARSDVAPTRPDTVPDPTPVVETILTTLGHDAFQDTALGPAGLQTLAGLLLTPGPVTIRTIAAHTGRSTDTVRTVITQLTKAGLAHPVDDSPSFWTGPDPTRFDLIPDQVDRLAERLGTVGRRAAREAERMVRVEERRAAMEVRRLEGALRRLVERCPLPEDVDDRVAMAAWLDDIAPQVGSVAGRAGVEIEQAAAVLAGMLDLGDGEAAERRRDLLPELIARRTDSD